MARLISEGLTNGEIAERLGISLDGAKYHVSELLGRLGFERRRQIADWYRREQGNTIRRRLRALVSMSMSWSTGAGAVAAAVVLLLLYIALSSALLDSENDAASTSSLSETIESSGDIGTFISAGPLNQPRIGHAATLLDDGRVLVTGGSGLSGDTAEIYDPDTRQFTATSSMHALRASHTATLLEDGRVLVVGGTSRTAEAFDPADETFHLVGETLATRRLHSAVRLNDGRVFLIGGADFPRPSAELFDPTRNAFVPAGELVKGPRQGATATLLQNGRVLVTGGCCDPDNIPRATAEVYDPVTATFTLLDETLSYGSMTHTATLLADGRVWISTGDIFDPASNSFTRAADFDRGREATVTLQDGTMIELGGFVDYEIGTIDSVVRFDAASGTTLGTTTLLEPRQGHTATVLRHGTVLVVGGGAGGTNDDINVRPLASAELYLP